MSLWYVKDDDDDDDDVENGNVHTHECNETRAENEADNKESNENVYEWIVQFTKNTNMK